MPKDLVRFGFGVLSEKYILHLYSLQGSDNAIVTFLLQRRSQQL